MHRRIGARSVWLAFALMIILMPAALAATVVGETNYELAAGETVEDDLYAFANTVTINGTVEGDLIAAGTTVVLGPEGLVTGDLIAAGQQVLVEGMVEDDIRAAGFEVKLAPGGGVTDDLIAAGFSVEAAAESTVGGDVMAAGYQGLMNGEFGGYLSFSGSALELNGQVDGDLKVKVDPEGGAAPLMMFPGMPQVRTIGPGFHQGSDAVVSGEIDVTTTAAKEKKDTDEEDAAERAQPSRALRWLVSVIQDYVALLVVGLLLLWLVPRVMTAAEEVVTARALPSAGWGCLTAFVAFVGLLALGVATILALIVIGVISIDPLVGPVVSTSAVLGSLLTFGMYILSWVARAVVGSWIGRWLLARFAPDAGTRRYVPLIIGLVVFAVLMNVPRVGFLFDWAGIFVGLGGLALASRPYWPRGGEAAVTAEPMPTA